VAITGKGHLVLLKADLGGVAFIIVLLKKVVTGESQDNQSIVFVGLVNLLQALELRGVATVAGGIHDQQRFALVGFAKLNCFGRCQLAHRVVQKIRTRGEHCVAEEG
jgi:hypothetical protein